MKKIGLFLLIFSVFTLTNAQENFISVNGQSISKKDFEKKFSQNIEVEGWEQAINTYIDAELLLQAAQKKQLDTTKVYQKFSGVAKADLFIEYQYPTKKKDSLLKLFAQRQQIQKKVAYFQFPIENEASVESRNSAKEKAEELKKVVCQQKNSPAEKQYFKDNNTQPLYVSSLDFPLEIENTIYATPKGQCSSIQKYNRNFYFVKVLDERESPFLYTYSHLMVKEKSKIDSIYNLLNNGLDYFEAVKRYSEDKTTKNKNGLVNSLTASVPDEFFTVLNQLDYRTYSAPVESNDGWHILFLARKQSCENTEECIKFLKEKIAKERWDFLLEQDRENEVDNR